MVYVSHDCAKLLHIYVCLGLSIGVSRYVKLLLALSSTAIPSSGSRGTHYQDP
jgi:hypothetical protein